jgi:hypothetical protein
MADEVIATAQDLCEASQGGLERQNWFSNAEKNEEWIAWFKKRGVRMLKDATALGKWYMNVDVPYQPATEQDKNDLVALRKRVRRMLPGCEVVFIEEEYEGEKICVFQIEWSIEVS